MKANTSPLNRAALSLLLSCLASLAAPREARADSVRPFLSNDFGQSSSGGVNGDFLLQAQTATMDTRATESQASSPSAGAQTGDNGLQGKAVAGSSVTGDNSQVLGSNRANPVVTAEHREAKSRLYPTGYKPGVNKPIIGGEHRALPAMSMALSDQIACFGDRRPEVASMVGLSRVVDIKLSQPLESNTAAVGNPVNGVLVNDLILGDVVVAPAGASVLGHIEAVEVARTLASALNDPTRRFKSRGMLVIKFDEISDTKGNVIPIVGSLVRQKDIQEGKGRRETRVDKTGRLIKAEPTLTPGRQRFYNAGRIATMAPIPGNVLFVNLVGIPTTMAVAGGADPSFAYNKPMEDEVQENKRKKAFVYAFVTSLPGAPVVQAYVEKGNELELRNGDVLSVNVVIDSRNGRKIRKEETTLASARLYPTETSVSGVPIAGAPLPGASATASALLSDATANGKARSREVVRGEVLPTAAH